MIINPAGLALFYHKFGDSSSFEDEQSLASYFDIICRFTKRNFRESLRILALDSFLFFFYTHQSHYHLVLKCENRDIDKKMLESASECIIEEFLEKYKYLLGDFNGEISNFHSFSETLIEILTTKAKDYKNILLIEY
ncbi:MAG: hypothetical protein ACW980_00340 [Promethearchaeota archaeon]